MGFHTELVLHLFKHVNVASAIFENIETLFIKVILMNPPHGRTNSFYIIPNKFHLLSTFSNTGTRFGVHTFSIKLEILREIGINYYLHFEKE